MRWGTDVATSDDDTGAPATMLSPERERAVEHMGRMAGQALRHAAPADGAARAMNRAERRRQVRIVAAGVVVVIAAVIGLILTNGSGKERRPVTTDTIPFPAAGALSEYRIAKTILLTPDEYAPGFRVDVSNEGPAMVRYIAATVPACSAMLDVAFESVARPATIDFQYFHSPKPPSTFVEYVVVLADGGSAQRMYDAITGTDFLDGCVPGYWDALRSRGANPPFPFSRPTSHAPVTGGFGGDQTALRTFDATWFDDAGVELGTRRVMSATIRVGRTVTVMEALSEDVFGRPVVTEAQFRQAIEHVAARATGALAGTATPPIGTTPAATTVPQAVVVAPAGSASLTVQPVAGSRIWSTAVSHRGLVALETSKGGSGGAHIAVVDAGTGSVVDELDVDAQPGALQYSVDGNLLVSGLGVIGQNGLVVHLTSPTTSPEEFSVDGGRLVAAVAAIGPSAGTHDLAVFDAHSGRALTTFSGHGSSIVDVHFSPDGSKIASGDEAGVLHVWDAATGESLAELRTADGSAIIHLSFDAGGSRLLTVTASGEVQLWDPTSGTSLAQLADAGAGRTALLTADGGHVLTSDPGGGLSVWRTGDGALERRFGAGAVGPISPGSLSLDGTRLATADLDGGVTVWDVATGERIFQAIPPALDGPPTIVADGRSLVTVTGDTASIWQVS
jgi:hypothetical protein